MLSFMAEARLPLKVIILQKAYTHHLIQDPNYTAEGYRTTLIGQKAIFTSDCFSFACEGCSQAFLFPLK